MSWTDDIRCLYCDGRLPLYKKITDGQFCSAAHRKAYWQEHERLAVERLLKTHDMLRAYRPPGAAEAILGPSAVESEFDQELDQQFDQVEQQQVEQDFPESAGVLPFLTTTSPQWLPDSLATPEPEPVASAPIPIRPASAEVDVTASPVETLFSERPAPIDWTTRHDATVAPIDARVRVTYAGSMEVQPQTEELRQLIEEQVPMAGKLQLLPGQPSVGSIGSYVADAPVPADCVMQPQLLAEIDAKPASNALLVGGVQNVPFDRTPRIYGSLDAVASETSPETPPQFPPTAPVHRPRLLLAARKPAKERESAPAVAVQAAIAQPKPEVKVMAAAAVNQPRTTPVPDPKAPEAPMPSPGGLLPIAPAAASAKSESGLPSSTHFPPTLPQPLQTEPMRPTSKLEPFDEKPVGDLMTEPPAAHSSAAPPAGSAHKAHVWTHAIDFWKHAPRDLKTLVFAIPVLLGLALHPTLPKVRVTAPSTGGIQRGFQRALNEQLVSVRQTMVDRAAVALDDDFRAGLDEWGSRGDATTEWSFDATGFVQPGPLALYKPSTGLTDYQMQFLGMIDKKALSWVVRAADFDNYYVIKLVVLKPGPVPTIGVTRYAVVNGRPDSRVDTPVPIDARTDMLYRVRLDVRGETFVLAVQGQMVDTWSEPRLRHGGVGFFTARDEASRVRWLQVTHQYDMLGRLCAYLAPYNISSTNGGWQQ